MKMDGCKFDVIVYILMFYVYNVLGIYIYIWVKDFFLLILIFLECFLWFLEKWEKVCEFFLEMEENGVELDIIVCLVLMRVFNKGG